MRIRAVRPEFWADETLGHLSDAVRLFYIGLWCFADDAGWLEYRPGQLGATLYPYRSVHRRERDIEGWTIALEAAGRIVRHPCGCAQIPTLTRHQRLGGKPSFQYRDRHGEHTSTDQSVLVRSDTPVSKGKVSRVEGSEGTLPSPSQRGPRAMGTNPRTTGESPRQLRARWKRDTDVLAPLNAALAARHEP